MSGQRMMMAAALAIGLGGLATGPALAGDGAKTAKDDTSRRICRNEVPVGSRLSVRTCRTKAEWDKAESRTQDGVLQHQVRNQTLLERSPGPR